MRGGRESAFGVQGGGGGKGMWGEEVRQKRGRRGGGGGYGAGEREREKQRASLAGWVPSHPKRREGHRSPFPSSFALGILSQFFRRVLAPR